jgi:hypothetical protein
MRLTIILLTIIMILFPACKKKNKLPDLDLKKPQVLRTLRVINPALPQLSEEDYRKTLDITAKAFKKYFNVEIVFDDRGSLSIREYFKKYYDPIAGENKLRDFILRADKSSIDALDIAMMIDYEDTPLAELKEFTSALIPEEALAKLKSRESFFGYIARMHIRKLKIINKIKLADGKHLGGWPYNQYLNWSHLAVNQGDYDFVFTNQLLASAEAKDTSLHASLRGGISSGVTFQSKTSYNGMVVMSSAPFLLNQDFFVDERGYSSAATEAPTLIGTYTTHEFGHLITHFGHPAGPGSEHCIMRPAVGLHYKIWLDLVTGSPCTIEVPRITSFE